MAAKEPSEDDEMDLINAEFESMVAGLNLDQSSPRTYLDELEDAQKVKSSIPPLPQRRRRNFHQRVSDSFSAIKRWWSSRGNNESDGAVV
ncbi:MAG: hypothetical protein ACKOXI_03555 [Candidatus Planktophila sp.]